MNDVDTQSRNGDIANSTEDRKRKVLATTISVLLAVVGCFFVYSIVTSLDRSFCQLCTEASTILPPFVWYTTWCLVTTCINWAIYVRRRFFAGTASPKSNIPVLLFQLCLPMSATVSLAYTFYLITNDWGRDIVNNDICYTVSDSAIPKEGTSRLAAAIFLVLDRLSNFTAHYFCAAINLTLYFKSYERGDWRPFAPLCFIILQSILIVVMHEFVDDVYCTDNILLDCALTTFLFGALHAVFFCRNRKSLAHSDEVLQNIERPLGLE